MHKFCSAKWGRKQEIWNKKKASATSNVIWKTEWKNEMLLPIPHKWVNYVPFQSLMFMCITFTKDHSWRISDQCNLMAFDYASSHQHILLTINPQEMSCALLASILKKGDRLRLCELHPLIAGLLHCPSVISLVDVSYVIWCLVIQEIETQEKVM